MKFDTTYNGFASGERTVAQSADAPRLPNTRLPLPPIQQQPERPYPWIVMRMQ